MLALDVDSGQNILISQKRCQNNCLVKSCLLNESKPDSCRRHRKKPLWNHHPHCKHQPPHSPLSSTELCRAWGSETPKGVSKINHQNTNSTCSFFLIILICCLQTVHAAMTWSAFWFEAILPWASPIPAATFFFCCCFFKSFLEAGMLNWLGEYKFSCRSESSNISLV